MFELIFENQNFVVADKPHGVLSVPGRLGAHGEDQRTVLGLELEKKLGRLWPVHRLDFEVSGLVLFARSSEAQKVASQWFEARAVHKFYEALSEGAAPEGETSFEWTSKLLRGKRRAYESPHGKPSVTRAWWQGESDFNGARAQRWRLEPLTGRPHQLRVELARHGYPIVGDELYGAKSRFGDHAIALRAVKIDFQACPQASSYGLPAAIEVKGLK